MRPDKKRTILIFLCGALAAGVSVIWFLSSYERKPVEIHTGMSPAAYRNPLLAATRFLQSLGRHAESHRGRDLLITLPPAGDAIVIYRQAGTLSPTERDALFDWMSAGGHLILQPKEVSPDKDNDGTAAGGIAQAVGVRLRYQNSDTDCGCPSKPKRDDETGTGTPAGAPADPTKAKPPDIQHPSKSSTASTDASAEKPVKKKDTHDAVTVTTDGMQVDIDFPNRYYLESGEKAPLFRIGVPGQDGAYLLQYRIGKGKLTFLAASSIFSNSRIDGNGRAWLLAWLVKDNPNTWLLYSNNMDGIFTMLIHRMPRFLFSLAGLVLFFIWRYQYRIGPPRDPPDKTRRHILAHIDGLGQFNWDLDQAAGLLSRVREPVLQYWSRRSPRKGISAIDPETVGRLSGLTGDEIKAGLFGTVKSEQDLIGVARTLQQLRQAGSARRQKP